MVILAFSASIYSFDWLVMILVHWASSINQGTSLPPMAGGKITAMHPPRVPDAMLAVSSPKGIQRRVLCDENPNRNDIGKHRVWELRWDSRFSVKVDERINCDLTENHIDNSVDANTSESHSKNSDVWNHHSNIVSDKWNVFVILKRMSTAHFLLWEQKETERRTQKPAVFQPFFLLPR